MLSEGLQIVDAERKGSFKEVTDETRGGGGLVRGSLLDGGAVLLNETFPP